MIQSVLKSSLKKTWEWTPFNINSSDAFKFYLQTLDILKREAERRKL